MFRQSIHSALLDPLLAVLRGSQFPTLVRISFCAWSFLCHDHESIIGYWTALADIGVPCFAHYCRSLMLEWNFEVAELAPDKRPWNTFIYHFRPILFSSNELCCFVAFILQNSHGVVPWASLIATVICFCTVSTISTIRFHHGICSFCGREPGLFLFWGRGRGAEEGSQSKLLRIKWSANLKTMRVGINTHDVDVEIWPQLTFLLTCWSLIYRTQLTKNCLSQTCTTIQGSENRSPRSALQQHFFCFL